MSIAHAIHLLTRPCCIRPVCKRDERKALRTAGLAIFGQEDAGDTAVTLEHVSKVVFFCELGDLMFMISMCSNGQYAFAV